MSLECRDGLGKELVEDRVTRVMRSQLLMIVGMEGAGIEVGVVSGASVILFGGVNK